jgi:trafficking protein particle complex subunit 4
MLKRHETVIFNLEPTRSWSLPNIMLHAILIINKAGGLIYNKDLANGISKLTSNEYLVLAGTLHGIHAITSQISPISNSTGLEFLQAGNLSFYCFQTPTGN